MQVRIQQKEQQFLQITFCESYNKQSKRWTRLSSMNYIWREKESSFPCQKYLTALEKSNLNKVNVES